MGWQNATYSWLLLLLPLLAWLGYRSYTWHRRKLQALAPTPRDRQRLLGMPTIPSPAAAMVRYLLAAACMVLAILNPQREASRLALPGEAVRLLLMIDLSNSMYATDIAPTRLHNARSLALRVQEGLPGAQLGVLLFAGTAWLALPVTPDAMAVRQVLQTMAPEQMPLQGTNLGQALQVAAQAFGSVPLAPKAVLLITDGEDLEDGIGPGLEAMRQMDARIYTVGIGTAQGSPLRLPGSIQSLTGPDGEVVISRLDESTLQDLADATGGTYHPYQAGSQAWIDEIIAQLQKVATQPVNDQRVIQYQSYAPWLVLAALALLLWPGKLHLCRPTRAKPMAMVALLMATQAAAQLPGDTAALLERGHAAWLQQDMPTALRFYNEVLRQHPNHYVSRFQAGLAMLRRQQFKEAAEQFANLASTPQPAPIQGAALYNQGLALAQQGHHAAAIEALQKAQRLLPNHPDVRASLQKALLEKPKTSPPPPPRPQNKPSEQPPLDPEEAAQKLQAIQEAEKKIRQQQKKGGSGQIPTKAW